MTSIRIRSVDVSVDGQKEPDQQKKVHIYQGIHYKPVFNCIL